MNLVVYRLPAIAATLFYWITMKVVQQLTCLTLYRPAQWTDLLDRWAVEHDRDDWLLTCCWEESSATTWGHESDAARQTTKITVCRLQTLNSVTGAIAHTNTCSARTSYTCRLLLTPTYDTMILRISPTVKNWRVAGLVYHMEAQFNVLHRPSTRTFIRCNLLVHVWCVTNVTPLLTLSEL